MARRQQSSRAGIVDQQLEDELRALGWRDEHEKDTSIFLLGEDLQGVTHGLQEGLQLGHLGQEVDFTAIGEVDESLLQLTEEDFNDPEFERELREIGWDDDAAEGPEIGEIGDDVGHRGVGGAVAGLAVPGELDLLTGDSGKEQQEQKAPGAEDTRKKAAELKKQALAMKRAGNQAEALKIMRQAKLLEEGYDMDAHVEEVAAVAQQRSSFELEQQRLHEEQQQQQQQKLEAERQALLLQQQQEQQRQQQQQREQQERLERQQQEERKQELPSPVDAPAAAATATNKAPAPVTIPAPTLEPARAAAQNAPTQGAMTAAQARATALKLKKEGDIAGALEWMKEAKRLESATASSLAIPATAAIVERSPTGEDIFTPLEKALNEAMATRLQEAKAAQAAGNKKEAVEKFREYKHYEQELGVLESRRILQGARPALFEWRTSSQTVRVQNTELASDQIKIVIEEATGLQHFMAAHKSQQYSVNYDLSYPKDQTYQGQIRSTSADLEAGTATFGFEEIKFVKRARSTVGIFSRKKATFELVMHRGFFRSDITVGKAVVPLADLLTKCEIAGAFELMDGRKAAGAKIKIRLALRDPLETPEAKEIITRTLVLGPWPAPVVEGMSPITSPTTPAQQQLAAAQTIADSSDAVGVSTATDERSPTGRVGLTRQASDRATEPTGPEFDLLTEREKKDPLSVDHIESNDVFEAEIQIAEAKVRSIPKDSESRFQEELRLQLLQTKMNTLVLRVQREELQLDQYLAQLKNRIFRDNVLSRYLYAAGRKQEAAQVLRRMKIMQQEVQSAESGEEEEEG